MKFILSYVTLSDIDILNSQTTPQYVAIVCI